MGKKVKPLAKIDISTCHCVFVLNLLVPRRKGKSPATFLIEAGLYLSQLLVKD